MGVSLNNPDYLAELVGRYVPDRRVCVQAGAHEGQWPNFLARYFETVLTFEPEPESFARLAQNAAQNVYPIRAALWDTQQRAGFATEGKKRKKSHVDGGGRTPLVTIDGLVPAEGVGFICLDLEGAETNALVGARDTLAGQIPVVAVEIKHQWRYGFEASEDAVLEHLPRGYRAAARYGLDTVFVYD